MHRETDRVRDGCKLFNGVLVGRYALNDVERNNALKTLNNQPYVLAFISIVNSAVLSECSSYNFPNLKLIFIIYNII